jgi:PAS domain-containing protein
MERLDRVLLSTSAPRPNVNRAFGSGSVDVILQLADGKTQDCNETAEDILGFTLEQIQDCDSLDSLGQTIHEDGLSFPGKTHSATAALTSMQPISGVITGLVIAEAVRSR